MNSLPRNSKESRKVAWIVFLIFYFVLKQIRYFLKKWYRMKFWIWTTQTFQNYFNFLYNPRLWNATSIESHSPNLMNRNFGAFSANAKKVQRTQRRWRAVSRADRKINSFLDSGRDSELARKLAAGLFAPPEKPSTSSEKKMATPCPGFAPVRTYRKPHYFSLTPVIFRMTEGCTV